MSYFQFQYNRYPAMEADILRHIDEDTNYGLRPASLAENMKLPMNKITAWVTILKRRELVRFRKETSRYFRCRVTNCLVLTNLGSQRLAFLKENRPSTCSSRTANETRERGESALRTVANDLPAKGYRRAASKGPMISGARAAGGRRKQMSHVRGTAAGPGPAGQMKPAAAVRLRRRVTGFTGLRGPQ